MEEQQVVCDHRLSLWVKDKRELKAMVSQIRKHRGAVEIKPNPRHNNRVESWAVYVPKKGAVQRETQSRRRIEDAQRVSQETDDRDKVRGEVHLT